ncbi:MAG: HAD family hydrolase [Candidatus Ratteibacteria bacterium]|nr:HAD family hydrolase [Candidatus Ratteibacteria bacterium]
MNKKVRVVSFDVDGTLIDQRFNDLIWENDIPALVAHKRGCSFLEAKKFCLCEYRKLGDKDLRWYDVQHWLKKFGISTSAKDIFKRREQLIIVYPDVLPVLRKLKEEGFRVIVITCMPRIFLKEKIKKFDRHFDKVFSTISDFKRVKSPELYRHISKVIKTSPSCILHIGDHHILDYEFSLEAGYKSILIEREKKTKDFSISRLEEIFYFL